MEAPVAAPRKDLVVLLPDKNMEAAIRAILERPFAIGIRSVTYDVFVHVGRDPGVVREVHRFLQPLVAAYDHALFMCDREGCGLEAGGDAIAQEMRTRLGAAGWLDRCEVLVLDPELEVWVWSDSPHVAKALGWGDAALRRWLRIEGFLDQGQIKPDRPKEAMELALLKSRKPRSSAVYAAIARRVSLRRCQDPSFVRLTRRLREWFPSPH